MKKIVYLLLFTLIAVTLTACKSEEKDLNKVLDSIKVPSEVSSDFTLTSKVESYNITWTSDHASITVGKNEDNLVSFIVTSTNSDVSVNLTAGISVKERTATKKFTIVVLKTETFFEVAFEGDGVSIEALQILEGGLAQAPKNPSRDGYIFSGWLLDGEPYSFSQPVVSNITLQASWTKILPDQIVVNFVSDQINLADITLDSNSSLPDVEIAEVEGYKFIGFFTDNEFKVAFDLTTKLTANTTLYLKFDELSAQEKIEQAASHLDNLVLSFDENNHVSLLSQGLNKTNVIWSFDQKNLTKSGYAIPTKLGESETTVLLSATIRGSRGTSPVTITKELIIPTYELINEVTSSKDIDFINLTSEYNVANSVLRTYFVDSKEIPYVDIKDFLDMLGKGSLDEEEMTDDQINGFIYSEEIEYLHEGNHLTISYDITYSDNQTETYSILIDFLENTITVDTLSFFDGYVKSTSTNYSLGISYLDTYSEEGHQTVFDLDNYRLDITIHTDPSGVKFLMPFHLVNQLFTGGSYYNVYFNGDAYYGIYSSPEGDDYNAIKTSSKNSTSVPYDLNLINYDMFAFILDYFYGLKEDRNVESYYDLLVNYNDGFFSPNATISANAQFDFINRTLDDLHTSSGFYSYYTDPDFDIPLTSIMQLGPLVSSWYNVLWDIQDAIKGRNGNDAYRLLEDNETAVLYLDGFITASSESLKNDPNAFDTDLYFQETLDAIFEENANIKNIIVDLSYNTGGNLGALLRVFGYITNEPIQMSYQDPTEGTNLTYFAEVENYRYEKDAQGNYLLDENYNRIIKKDAQGNPVIVEAREDINWYFLTSKVTFSAANLMTAIGKNQNIAKIIGTTSGGGASSIIPVSLPNGSFFTMSSLNVLSIRIDNGDGTYTYQSIEHGITPDYILNPLDTLDDNKILAILNNL